MESQHQHDLSAWLLPMLMAVVAALLLAALADAAVDRPASSRPALPRQPITTSAFCGVGILLDGIWLIARADDTSLELPIGFPGAAAGVVLALDSLSALFLLLLFILGAACSLALTRDAARLPAFPVLIAAMAITLLAGDSVCLLTGFGLMSLAAWALVLTHADQPGAPEAAQLHLGLSIFSAACLVGALALLTPPGARLDTSFATIRLAQPEGARATAALVLTLLGAGAQAGLAPLHVWLPRAHAVAPAPVAALLSGVMTKVALYVLIRILLDLCGPVAPVWWGLPLLAAGAAAAVLGGLRATQEADLKAVLAASTIAHVGLIVIGIGIALMARGSDLPALAALALAGALLHALTHGVFKALLFLGVGAVQHSAGTRRLALLGGLIHRMPVTTACMLVGAASLAALPPGAGFASQWLLLQSVLAAARNGGVAMQTLVTVTAAAMALASGLGAAAAVRLLGVAFLGRPRGPRGAGAIEVALPLRTAMLALAGLLVAMGLFPGLVLAMIGPAARLLTSDGLEQRVGALSIATQIGMPGYAAIGISLLLLALLLVVILLARRFMVRGERRAPAWDCGFAAPPEWLPFGDPATQYGVVSFAQPLGRILGTTILARQEQVSHARCGVTTADPADRWLFQPALRLREDIPARLGRMQCLTIRGALVVMFGLLVLLLAIVAWREAG